MFSAEELNMLIDYALFPGALMSVDETLMCSFQILKPADKRKLYSGLNMGRPNTPPRAQPKNKKK